MKTDELTIYRDTFELVRMVTKLHVQIHNMFKPTIGKRMVDTSLDLLYCISMANSSKDDRTLRASYLSQLLQKLEFLEICIRLCSEEKMMSTKAKARLARQMDIVMRQTVGWRKSMLK